MPDIIIKTNKEIVLPYWLDDFIFNNLKAKYKKKNADLVVLEWNKDDILCYLGTYFPRSFAESYYIFSNYLEKDRQIGKNGSISVFDFGCGTGGELVGLICAIKDIKPNISTINIRALDGNQNALYLLEQILSKVSQQLNINIQFRLTPIVIDDFYDLDIITGIINQKFDVFITFKAICEFVTRQQFEEKNPYSHIIASFKPKINENGIMCIADVTTYSDISNDWLPKMMDRGISTQGFSLVDKNSGYNESFTVTHSLKQRDISKIAWRILKKQNNETRLDD